jgi:hypothetical protein
MLRSNWAAGVGKSQRVPFLSGGYLVCVDAAPLSEVGRLIQCFHEGHVDGIDVDIVMALHLPAKHEPQSAKTLIGQISLSPPA